MKASCNKSKVAEIVFLNKEGNSFASERFLARKSQFMNNKILFIKHSTIKRNVASDFPINIFTSSLSTLVPYLLLTFSVLPWTLGEFFVSGELYHFIAIIFIILLEHEFLHPAQRVVDWFRSVEMLHKPRNRGEISGDSREHENTFNAVLSRNLPRFLSRKTKSYLIILRGWPVWHSRDLCVFIAPPQQRKNDEKLFKFLINFWI